MFQMKVEDHKYPTIALISSLMDLGVMVDLIEESPTIHPEFEYCLGTIGDPDAGLPSSRWSPYFRSLEELEAFCVAQRGGYTGVRWIDPRKNLPEVRVENMNQVPDFRSNRRVGVSCVSGEEQTKEKMIALLYEAATLSNDVLGMFVQGHPFSDTLHGIIGHLQRSIDPSRFDPTFPSSTGGDPSFSSVDANISSDDREVLNALGPLPLAPHRRYRDPLSAKEWANNSHPPMEPAESCVPFQVVAVKPIE